MIVLIFCLLASLLSAQQNITIRQTVFVPPEFYVGDQVELRLLVDTENPDALLIPSQLPVHEFIDIRRVELVRVGAQTWVNITFVSYAPGERVLPTLQLGGGSIAGVSITTRSLLGAEQELRPYLDPLPLPQTVAQISLLLFLVLGLPVLLFYGLRWVGRFYRSLGEIYRRVLPYRYLSNKLEHLKKNSYRLSAREFYEELNVSIRRWIVATSGDSGLSSLTATEMAAVISDYIPSEGMVWVDLLSRCERFIYSGTENLPEARMDDVERALASLRTLTDHAGRKKVSAS